MAPLNLPAQVPVHASQLYARNILNFLGLIVKKGELQVDLSDEVLAGSLRRAPRKASESAGGEAAGRYGASLAN